MDIERFWQDVGPTYLFATDSLAKLHGTHACFCLQLTKHVVKTSDGILIKAYEAQLSCSQTDPVSVQRPSSCSTGARVILRATQQDVDILVHRVSEIRVIPAFFQHKDGITILDGTSGLDSIRGPFRLNSTRFCRSLTSLPGPCWLEPRDSFSSWWGFACPRLLDFGARAILLAILAGHGLVSHFCLRSNGHSCHVVALCAACQAGHPLLLSPPCQPRSIAGKAEGFGSIDGLLLLEAIDFIDFIRVASVPIVAVEQVDGFPLHKHFELFYAAMRKAGVVCRWRSPFQLADISAAC